MSNPQEIFKAGTGMNESYVALAKPKFQFQVWYGLPYKWKKTAGAFSSLFTSNVLTF